MRLVVGSVFGFLLAGLTALVSVSGTASLLVGIVTICLALLVTAVTVWGSRSVGTTLVVAAVFLAPLDDLRPGASLVTASDLAFVLGFTLLGPTLLRRRARLPGVFLLGAAGLLVTTLVATMLADQWVTSLAFGFRMIAAVVLLPLAYAWWQPSSRLIDRMAWAYIGGQCVSTLYGLVDGIVVDGRHFGWTTHPNFLGISGMIAAALALYLWPRTAGLQRFVLLGAGAISVYGVILSGSRAATISIVILALLYPLVERSTASGYLVVAGGVVGAISINWLIEFFGPTSVFARLLPGDLGADFSDQARAVALETYWERFLARPVTGEGFLAEQYEAHNVYLQIAVAIGVFGLLAFVTLGWSLMRPLFERGPRHGLAYMAVAYAAIAPLTPSIWDRNVWAGLGLAILASGAGRRDATPDEPDSSPAPVGAPMTAPVAPGLLSSPTPRPREQVS